MNKVGLVNGTQITIFEMREEGLPYIKNKECQIFQDVQEGGRLKVYIGNGVGFVTSVIKNIIMVGVIFILETMRGVIVGRTSL